MRTFLDSEPGAEEVYGADGEFIGAIKRNADGTYQIDACRGWGNLTSPNQPNRETAVNELVEHAAYRNRIDALGSQK